MNLRTKRGAGDSRGFDHDPLSLTVDNSKHQQIGPLLILHKGFALVALDDQAQSTYSKAAAVVFETVSGEWRRFVVHRDAAALRVQPPD